MAILAYFLVSVTLVVAGLSISVQPADAQSSAPSAGLASIRARLSGPDGALLVAPRSDTELYAGTLSAAEMPELLALARECAVLPARTEITLNASLGDAPVKVKVERDKGGRLEVQLRGIPFPDRARLFEVAESFLARGAFDVIVPAEPADLRPQDQDSAADRGAPPAPEAPQGAGLNNNRGAVRVEGNGHADSQAVALFGRIVAGDFVTGASSSSMSFVLRREGTVRRGTATGSRNVPITIEFVKDGP